MNLFGKEHYDLLAIFEKTYKLGDPSYETKDQWARGYIYTNGDINKEFIAFRAGYAVAKAIFGVNE